MYRHLTKLRLRWYALATGRILLRHWQLFVMAGAFVPANVPVEGVLYALAFPLMALLNTGHDLLWYLSYIFLIQFVALTWVLVQKNNISGNEFMTYLNTLPVSLSLRRRVNLTVLLFANGLLLVPVIGWVLIAPTRLVQTADKGFLIAVVCALVFLVHLIQLVALERQRAGFIALAFADLFLGWSLSHPVNFASWLALGATLVSAALSLSQYKKIRTQAVRPRYLQFVGLNLFARLAPDWLIPAKALWLHYPASSAIRMGIAIALASGAVGLMNIFNFDGRTLPAAVLAMGLITLVVSSFYRVLKTIHLPMQHYLSSLPLPRHFWTLRDTASVLLFGAVPLIILIAPVLHHAGLKPVVALVLAYFCLLALLRLPLLYGGRQALLLSVILVTVWSGVALTAIL